MDDDRQREIASTGGKAAHEKGTAHEFSSEEAREAGRKGGESVSQDREHMAEIGRKGGEIVSQDREHMAEIGRKGGEARGDGAENDDGRSGSGQGQRGGSHEQHVRAGQQSHKNR
ncbi:KGG domain-containing protein [Sorangium sp. So ce363]|uniref:KGG domain-containing protein n=1 Tax=Sorangium sp. So ce363 TaxID=3133304 RepID=UPI003F5EEEB6